VTGPRSEGVPKLTMFLQQCRRRQDDDKRLVPVESPVAGVSLMAIVGQGRDTAETSGGAFCDVGLGVVTVVDVGLGRGVVRAAGDRDRRASELGGCVGGTEGGAGEIKSRRLVKRRSSQSGHGQNEKRNPSRAKKAQSGRKQPVSLGTCLPITLSYGYSIHQPWLSMSFNFVRAGLCIIDPIPSRYTL
jgi:hypothetical protein